MSLNAQLNLFITLTVLKFFLRQTSLVLMYIFAPDLFPVTKLMIYYLTPDECKSCEGDITLHELTTSHKHMVHNKSRGPDGLCVGRYSTFWARLAPILVRVFNVCYSRDDLLDSMKECNLLNF